MGKFSCKHTTELLIKLNNLFHRQTTTQNQDTESSFYEVS
jgi:hypothetical protein